MRRLMTTFLVLGLFGCGDDSAPTMGMDSGGAEAAVDAPMTVPGAPST